MTAYGTEHEHEDVLRHALRAAGDSIQPGPDGLHRISHRLTKPRPLPVALGIAWLDWLHRSLTVTVPCAAEQAWDAMLPARKQTRHAVTLMIGLASQSGRPVAAAEGHRAKRSGLLAFGRMRPVAAMFVAIFVVAAAGYVFFALPRAISPGQAIGWPFATSPKHAHTHGHRSAGRGPSGSTGNQPSSGTGNSTTANSGVNCHPGKSGSSPVSPNPSTAPSSSASPSPSNSSTSPSPSSSTSTSPSPSSSPSAGGSGSPGSGSGGTTTPDISGSNAHRQINPDKTTRHSGRPKKHKHHSKANQSCGTATAYRVPAAQHGAGQDRGDQALALAAPQLTALSRDPADAASL
jgi:hypothetical protein